MINLHQANNLNLAAILTLHKTFAWNYNIPSLYDTRQFIIFVKYCTCCLNKQNFLFTMVLLVLEINLLNNINGTGTNLIQ
jgi:hypothetical protein